MWKTIIMYLLHAQVGIATNFSATGDPGNPIPYAACLRRDLRDNDVIIAQKILPCKSKVFIYSLRTKRGIVATVGDRGPRKALLDANVAVTKALRLNGREAVVMVPLD